MSTIKQNLVEPTQTKTPGSGVSSISNLKKAFPNAPQYNEYKDDFVKELYEDLLNNANDGAQDHSDFNGYYGMSGLSLNYNENNPPKLEDVETGGGGLPATSFSPNVTSPGPGSTNAAAQPEYTGDVKNIDTINNFGSGLGGLVSPSETSINMSDTKLGSYISGRSFQGSNGNT